MLHTRLFLFVFKLKVGGGGVTDKIQNLAFTQHLNGSKLGRVLCLHFEVSGT